MGRKYIFWLKGPGKIPFKITSFWPKGRAKKGQAKKGQANKGQYGKSSTFRRLLYLYCFLLYPVLMCLFQFGDRYLLLIFGVLVKIFVFSKNLMILSILQYMQYSLYLCLALVKFKVVVI